MPVSKAHIQASRKYNEKAYDRIELRVPKGKKANLKAHASERGESLNGFVNRAIDEALEREASIGDNELVRNEPHQEHTKYITLLLRFARKL